MNIDNKTKKAQIITICNEVLIGAITDHNTAYTAKRLADHGTVTINASVLRNDREDIIRAVTYPRPDADYTFIIGGLGTGDEDITCQCIAEALGVDLIQDERAANAITKELEKLGSKPLAGDMKRSFFPEGAKVLHDEDGMPHGFVARSRDAHLFIALPGKPHDLHTALELLEKTYRIGAKKSIFTKTVNILSASEFTVVHALKQVELTDGCSAIYTCNRFNTGIRLTVNAANAAEADEIARKNIELLRKTRLGKYIYGMDEAPEYALLRHLKAAQKTVSTAESCTGGLIAKLITDCPGSSEVFPGGIVTYANTIKSDVLGVPGSDIADHGAVSHQVAAEMAAHVRRKFGSDYGIATTGIAGPDGATDTKPVGLVYIGVSSKNATTVYKRIYEGDRDAVRNQAANTAIKLLISRLMGNE